MDGKFLYLLAAVESLALLGVIFSYTARSTRPLFLTGFAALLPATVILTLYGHGAVWRRALILAFVLVYLLRMVWVLTVWYLNTTASKLRERLSPMMFHSLPVVLTNVTGWLYGLPFLWACDRPEGFNAWDGGAIAVYLLGTLFHLGADYQKRRFKLRADSRGKVLDTGFWRMSRHPNYFGDFLIYLSFAIISASPLGLIAPFANLLQYFGDAIPKSEKMAHDRYGAAWECYRRKVPCFIPFVV